jgi:serine/threonine protein kinase
MSSSHERERAIFTGALDLPAAERPAFLARACGDDPVLRAAVEELLQLHEGGGEFLADTPGPMGGLSHAVDNTLVMERDSEAEQARMDGLHFLDPSPNAAYLGKLAQYEVVEVIGRGGMGIVLRAHDPKLDRIVAIKVMAPELAASPVAARRFLREAQAAAAVSHDHVVTIHAVDDAFRLPYLVMEYVDGVSLDGLLKREAPLDLRKTLRIGMQIASGLAAAHKQGLVHRDIKPANILLENGVQRVKITDFGLARAVDDSSLTQSGSVAGSPGFMSPEQAAGEHVDQRTDLFSLGSVMYVMCTGQLPFQAESTLAMLGAVCSQRQKPVRELNPRIPEAVEQVIHRLLEKDPAQRYQTAAEVAGILEEQLAQVQVGGVPRPVTSRLPATTVLKWAIASVVLLAVVGTAAALKKRARMPADPKPVTVAPKSTNESLPVGFIGPGRRVDLVAQAEPERDTVTGIWVKADGLLLHKAQGSELSPGSTPDRFRLPVIVNGDYRLRFRFRTLDQRDTYKPVMVVLPIGTEGRSVAAYISDKSSLSNIDRLDTRPENPTYTEKFVHRRDVWHTVEFTVKHHRESDEATIQMEVDGRKLIDWSGKDTRLSIWRNGLSLGRNGVPGLAVYDKETEFGDISLEMLSGHAMPVLSQP